MTHSVPYEFVRFLSSLFNWSLLDCISTCSISHSVFVQFLTTLMKHVCQTFIHINILLSHWLWFTVVYICDWRWYHAAVFTFKPSCQCELAFLNVLYIYSILSRIDLFYISHFAKTLFLNTRVFFKKSVLYLNTLCKFGSKFISILKMTFKFCMIFVFLFYILFSMNTFQLFY